MLRHLFVCGIVLAAPCVHAQGSGTEPDDLRPRTTFLGPQSTAYTVGYSATDFRYVSPHSGYVYSFDGSALSFMISSHQSSLSVAYGGNQPTTTVSGAISEHTLIDVALRAGGNVGIVTIPGPVPFAAYVPIRVHLGYRNVSARATSPTEDAPSALHMPSAGIAAGGGAWIRIPTDVPLIEDRLVGFGSLTFGYGGLADVGAEIEFDEIRATRTTELNLEARLERFLANRTGLTIGYTFRSMTWTNLQPSDATDPSVSLALTSISPYSRQHLLRVGFNW